MAAMGIKKTGHYILLVQCGNEQRTFSDYETLCSCLDGISKLFDNYLKQEKPFQQFISYDMRSLLLFVDSLPDLSCLVFNKGMNMYMPYDKNWIKEKLYEHFLKKHAVKVEQDDD